MEINVSVILTVYNKEKYLTECLNSIVNQSLKTIEIIIVNDGSTDNSLEIINKFANTDTRIKVLNQDNIGAAEARNNGIKISNGEYLSILDGDDLFDINMLESMYNQAKKNEVDILICPYRNFGDMHSAKKGLSLPNYINIELFSSYDIKEEIFQITNPAVWNKLFRKDFITFNNISFQNLSSCNDFYFSYFALSIATKLCILDKSFIEYRQEASLAISRSRGKNIFNIFEALKQLKKSLLTNNLYDMYLISYTKTVLASLSYESQFINDKNDMLKLILNIELFLKEI